MEGGWDRPRNRARTLGERDDNNEPLAEGNKDNDNKYSKGGNFSDDDDEYAVGVDGVGKPLEENNNQCCPRTSVPCKSAAERALTLRASYSQWAALRESYSQRTLRASYSQRRPLCWKKRYQLSSKSFLTLTR